MVQLLICTYAFYTAFYNGIFDKERLGWFVVPLVLGHLSAIVLTILGVGSWGWDDGDVLRDVCPSKNAGPGEPVLEVLWKPAMLTLLRELGSGGYIPCSSDNSELRWDYDTEIVSNLIAVIIPVLWHLLAEEGQHRGTEFLEGGVALVVGDMPVHQPP
jgi:hypothetical protein